MKSSTHIMLRRNSIFSILIWICIGGILLLIYPLIRENSGSYTIWSDHIDMTYSVFSVLICVIISAHTIGLIFREVEQAYILESMAMRRFFPLMSVLLISVVWIIGIFDILETLGVNMSSILTGAGIGGVLLAIASRDIITNLFGSLSILLSRTFEIGDIIRIRTKPGVTYEGVVEEITLNYTKLTHMSGEVVFVPNRTVYIETVENLSRRRFMEYIYRVPFRKQSSVIDIKTRMKLIESKIDSYDPISVTYDTEIPNAVDLVYKIIILLPEENEIFDSEMRHFLMEHIFIEHALVSTIPDLQK